MMQYRQEILQTAFSDALELFKLHWDEVALNKDFIELNPDYDSYHQHEQNDNLKIFTAREDKQLVGYFAVIVTYSLHYCDHKFATNDVIFMHKDHRKGMAGMKLIKFAMECLAEDGVSVLMMNTKVHRPYDAVLKRLKFDHIENVYSKRLI